MWLHLRNIKIECIRDEMVYAETMFQWQVHRGFIRIVLHASTVNHKPRSLTFQRAGSRCRLTITSLCTQQPTSEIGLSVRQGVFCLDLAKKSCRSKYFSKI